MAGKIRIQRGERSPLTYGRGPNGDLHVIPRAPTAAPPYRRRTTGATFGEAREPGGLARGARVSK